MKHTKIQPPDPFQQYGSNPLSLESIQIRRTHALVDERNRHSKALRTAKDELDAAHVAKVAEIEAHFAGEIESLRVEIAA